MSKCIHWVGNTKMDAELVILKHGILSLNINESNRLYKIPTHNLYNEVASSKFKSNQNPRLFFIFRTNHYAVMMALATTKLYIYLDHMHNYGKFQYSLFEIVVPNHLPPSPTSKQ